jgi:hypothetical protein
VPEAGHTGSGGVPPREGSGGGTGKAGAGAGDGVAPAEARAVSRVSSGASCKEDPAQATSHRLASIAPPRHNAMGLLLLEALLALVILLGVVWWTMFSGRKGGELPRDESMPDVPPAPPADGTDEAGSRKQP